MDGQKEQIMIMTIENNSKDVLDSAGAESSTTASDKQSGSETTPSNSENASCRATTASPGPVHKKLLKVGDCIGKGYYGKVKLGCALMKQTRSGEFFEKLLAVKEIQVSKQVPVVVEKFLMREIAVHKRCRHRNITLLYSHKEYFVREKLDKIRMFCEFCPNGTLLLYVKKYHLVLDNACRWFRQIANAVHYLHENEICHRDLKCDNILLDENWNAKLCDFGFAKSCSNQTGEPLELSTTFCGTAAYVAPELIRNEAYDPKAADVWSLGVVLHYMVTKKLPFGEVASSVFTAHEKVKPTFMVKPVTELHAASIDQLAECDALMRMLLIKDVAIRPTLRLVLMHTWLMRIDESETFISGDEALDYEFTEEVEEVSTTSSSMSSTMSLKSNDGRKSQRVCSHLAAYVRPTRAVTSKLQAVSKRLRKSFYRTSATANQMPTSDTPAVKNCEETVSKSSSSPTNECMSQQSEQDSVNPTELVIKSIGFTTDCGEKQSKIVIHHSTRFDSITAPLIEVKQVELSTLSPSLVMEMSSVSTSPSLKSVLVQKSTQQACKDDEEKHEDSNYVAQTPAVATLTDEFLSLSVTNSRAEETLHEETEKRLQNQSAFFNFRKQLRKLLPETRKRTVPLQSSTHM